jgi:hypothetical protein
MTAGSKDSKMRSPSHGGTSATGDGAVMGAVPEPLADDPEIQFRKRGINKSVWSRRYERYTPDDFAHVQLAHEPLSRTDHMGWLVKIVKQSPGWMCVRNAPPGIPLPDEPIVPQLRPDNDVETGGPPTIHHHPTNPPTGPVMNPYPYKDPAKRGRPLEEWRIFTAHQMRDHIAGKRGHNGVNNEEPHWEKPRGKYVFPPGEDRAKRADMHPDAVALFETATVVYIVLEGQWKADALLTRGCAVLSYPSVTLWEEGQTEAVARRFFGNKAIVIVIDADGHDNKLVMSQARYLQTFLEGLRLGGRVCVAAPPANRDAEGALLWKGVDDYLAHGYQDATFTDGNRSTWTHSPEGLHVHERDAPNLDDWKAALIAEGFTGIAANRLGRTLRFLALHANRRGEIPRTLTTIARVMGSSPKTARRSIEELERLGAIEIEGSLDAAEGRWVGRHYKDPKFGWIDPPLITIRPEFRAVDHEPVELGDWCNYERGAAVPIDTHTPEARNWRIRHARHVEGQDFAEIANAEGVGLTLVKGAAADLLGVQKLQQAFTVAVLREIDVPWKEIAKTIGVKSVRTAQDRLGLWNEMSPDTQMRVRLLFRTLDIVSAHDPALDELMLSLQFGPMAKRPESAHIEERERPDDTRQMKLAAQSASPTSIDEREE